MILRGQVQLPKGSFVTISNWPEPQNALLYRERAPSHVVCRHRNPELWGADADSFNPWRDFSQQDNVVDVSPMISLLLSRTYTVHAITRTYNTYMRGMYRVKELARVGCPMAAKTPSSQRFSPFAHNPRSCLGKNFAQMEMRLILSHILHRFDFALAPPYDTLKDAADLDQKKFRGVNLGGTMGPMDLERGGCAVTPGERFQIAMKLDVKARNPTRKPMGVA
eukprot:Skav204278  [mRNA]  locus=scaffold409:161520:165248:+ [translate_table: standard]